MGTPTSQKQDHHTIPSTRNCCCRCCRSCYCLHLRMSCVSRLRVGKPYSGVGIVCAEASSTESLALRRTKEERPIITAAATICMQHAACAPNKRCAPSRAWITDTPTHSTDAVHQMLLLLPPRTSCPSPTTAMPCAAVYGWVHHIGCLIHTCVYQVTFD